MLTRVFSALPPRDEQLLPLLACCPCCGRALYPGDLAAWREGDLLCTACAPEELSLFPAEDFFLPR